MGAKKLEEFLKTKANENPSSGKKTTRMIFLDKETNEIFEDFKAKNNLSNPEMVNALVDYILDKADHSNIQGEPDYNIRIGARLDRFEDLKKLIDDKRITLSKIIRDVLQGKL